MSLPSIINAVPLRERLVVIRPEPSALPETITILSADDHPLIRAGLSGVLGLERDMHVVAEAANGAEAVALYRALRPDVVLMDLRMPVMDGLAACTAIMDEFPDARVVMLTTYDGDEDIYRALDAGAQGYVLKDMVHAELVKVIRTVHAGRRGIPVAVAARLAEHTPRRALTARELEVLELISKGFSNPEIGRIIGRTEGTVKVHARNIMQKLKVTDRTEAVTVSVQRGLIRIA